MVRKPSFASAAGEDDGETVITRTTNLEGTLKSDSTVRIYGVFEGVIETAGTLIIGKAARVAANISAQHVGVAGMVKGNIAAIGRVEILSGGRVYGDIIAASLRIEEGAFFTGQSLMKTKEEQLLLEAPSEAEP